MHDIRFIRQEPEQFDKALGKRGLNPKAQEILKLDQDHRHLLTQLQELQNERNQLAKAFGQAKQKGEDTSDFSKRSEEIKALIPSLEEKEGQFKKEIEGILCTLPNKVMDETPLGEDETSNVILRTWGEPKTFDFVPKQHFELGEELCQMDFERAAKLSGSRFVVLKAGLARLERALAHFMLDLHTSEFGYTEVSAPLI
ncbi:MAG TPA: serine--tRNA ligase, partial [Alphaproteobacteria bacterium]|nr:serine--tRNA ligase [Alphaproteobacteria bacterium]